MLLRNDVNVLELCIPIQSQKDPSVLSCTLRSYETPAQLLNWIYGLQNSEKMFLRGLI